jgi:hypothetical protein
MDPLKAAFLSNTFTIEAAHRRLGLLQRVLETVLFNTDTASENRVVSYTATLAEFASPEDLTALTLWGTAWLAHFSAENFHTELGALRTYIDSLPRLVLYVPEMLDDTGSALVGSWCRTELKVSYLLDLEVDPDVIGGCAFVKDGRFIDYSFAAQLRSNPHLVSEVVASYAA